MKNFNAINVVFALVIIFVLSVTMVAQDVNQPGKASKGLKVTVMIYSGRPNPTFMITDKDVIEKIKKSLTDMPNNSKVKEDTVSPAVLGYKGILVENFSDEMIDTESFLVFHSNVEVKSKQAAESTEKNMKEDNSLGLQDMLIREAQNRNAIDQKMIDQIYKKK